MSCESKHQTQHLYVIMLKVAIVIDILWYGKYRDRASYLLRGCYEFCQ